MLPVPSTRSRNRPDRAGLVRELSPSPRPLELIRSMVCVLDRDDRLKKVNDLLLSGGCGVEFAAHLGESLVDVPFECPEVRSKVDKVLSERVEACHCGLAELTEIVVKSADVAVGGAGEYPGGRSVLLACLYLPGEVTHLMLKGSDAWLNLRIHE